MDGDIPNNSLAAVCKADEEHAKEKITARLIRGLLKERFNGDRGQYCTASEVGEKTGWQTRRMDYVVVNCWESDGLSIDGFEIKISKSDLRRELEDPDKHCLFFDWIDTFSLVAPENVIDMALIPPKWGVLMVIEKDGKYALKWKRKPLALRDERRDTINRAFAINLMRKIANASDAVALMEDKLQKEYERGVQDGMDRCRNSDYWELVEKRTVKKAKLMEAFMEDAGIEFTSEDSLKSIARYIRKLEDVHYTEMNLLSSLDHAEEGLKRMKESVKSFLDYMKENPGANHTKIESAKQELNKQEAKECTIPLG